MKPIKLPEDIKTLVKEEIMSSFLPCEIDGPSLTFEAFWSQVDVMNAYEEEWPKWKASGIKAIYQQVFEELRS